MPFPAPGTYKLDRIQRVPFSIVRDGPGLPHLLSTYTTGKITLLTFFYTLCTDPQGCPLAWNAFEAVREKIKADPVLHGKARLVFFSFDPVHDNGETLQFFAESYKADSAGSGRDASFISRPPHRTVRAAFPHTAPTSGE